MCFPLIKVACPSRYRALGTWQFKELNVKVPFGSQNLGEITYMRKLAVLFLTALVLAFSGVAFAQTETGQISGTFWTNKAMATNAKACHPQLGDGCRA